MDQNAPQRLPRHVRYRLPAISSAQPGLRLAEDRVEHLLGEEAGLCIALARMIRTDQGHVGQVADLRVAELGAPDDDLLRDVLEKLFRERNIKPADDIYPYLIRRIERSVPAAEDVVRRLDEAADEQQRPVSRALARQLLETDDQTLELFD